MKKAILLLGMMIFVAGVCVFRDAGADTILLNQRTVDKVLEPLLQSKEEAGNVKTDCENTPSAESEAEFGAESEAESGAEFGAESEAVFGAESGAETKETVTQKGVVRSSQPAGVSNVAFFRLSQTEQQVYSEILGSLQAMEQKTTLSTKDTALIDKAFRCVMMDHPEIFYVDGYKYTEYTGEEGIEKIVFSGKYIYDSVQVAQKQLQIEETIAHILEEMPDTEDEYEKVKYVYETIVSWTEYDTNAQDNQNICSVFLSGKSVCQGYAKATQYLLHRLGIEAGLITGTVGQGEGHAWNIVLINNNWYYLDATWGDAYYMFDTGQQNVPLTKPTSINYDYLCVTTKQMEKTHVMDMPVTVPDCTSVEDNYYVREGLYFERYEEERIRELFAKATEEGNETITIKCSDFTVYEAIRNELIEQQKVFGFLTSASGTIAYTDNPGQGSITFWL